MGWVAYRLDKAALASAAAALTMAVATADPAAAQTAAQAAAQTQTQTNQQFVQQGPAAEFGNYNWIGAADLTPNGTAAGAVQAVLLDPALGAGTIFAGSPNGGIFVSSNN